MPIREDVCLDTPGCPAHGQVIEHFFHPREDQPHPCPVCGRTMFRLASGFAVVFAGDITARYNIPSAENAWKDGAHWAWERNTPDGVPRPVRIESWQDQREYCKREGLVNPADINPGARISADGKKLDTVGMPGAWY